MSTKPHGRHQRTLAKLAPEMDPAHMETLAIAVGSSLDGLPISFFREIADLARQMGAVRLAEFQARMAF